ncbi:S8 family serine peptidase [Deinococcus sp. A31D244]|uniref:S8 family serine peptidase n=1 Tax=Deinococcus sp. A31D244 TaxID=3397675 RepID=UPI0039E04F54
MTRTSTLLLLPLTSALLLGCNAPSSAGPEAAPDRPGYSDTRYDAVMSVEVQGDDTVAALEATLGGTVLAWPQPGCADAVACAALVGVNAAPATDPDSLIALRVAALDGRAIHVERNRDVFSGGGALTAQIGGSRNIWAGGNFLTWSGGSRNIWAGGQYQAVPENTQIWTRIRLEQAHRLTPNLGAGVTVAVIDTGLDLQHSAFQGSLSDPSTWWDFYAGDAVPQEEGTLGTGAYGHGTNVAGIILQVAPRARIMPLRVLGADGSGDVANVARAITWAAAKGAQVINLSLGSAESSKVVQDAINKVTAQNVIVVASAGNENRNRITYPAATASSGKAGERALSVGSVDLLDRKSSFSNYTKGLELVAPGEQVYAPAPGELMAAWSGTSMAAPMVTGGLALAFGQPLAVAVKDLTLKLAENASDVYNNGANQAYKDMLGVKGRLDLEAFLANSVRN